MKNKATLSDMVAAVFAHAGMNYDHSGWDYVVECWSELDVARAVENAGAQTEDEAIDVVGCEVALRDEVRRDVQGWAD